MPVAWQCPRCREVMDRKFRRSHLIVELSLRKWLNVTLGRILG